MKRSLLSIAILFFVFADKADGQSCFNISAGPDIYTSCLVNCNDITVKVPDIRTSENYKVVSIPYDPFPFVTAAPAFFHPCNVDPDTDQDDKFVDQATLPFNFCFYGNTLTKYVLGTNGVISFDKNDALQSNNYEVTHVLPFYKETGSTRFYNDCDPNDIPSGAWYPKLAILGLYHDMFPIRGEPYKIEARIEGSAPCRKFIMSYNEVKLYNCQNVTSTFQVVLHEGTGIIDIFIKEKPACNTNVLIGIQDYDNGKALSPPGRDLFTTPLSNEAWRFVPNGNTSLLSRVELYKNNVLFSSTYNIDNPGTGELNVTFPNVCQAEDSMSYVVKAFYKQCDNPALETEGSDTIIIRKTLNPLDVTATDATCTASSDGKLTINDPIGANIEYSIDGTNWQTSNVFSVASGTYTVIARVIGSTCTGKIDKTVGAMPAVPITYTEVDPNCPATATGTITVTAPVGSNIQYSINGGTSWQSSPVFTVAAGSYDIITRSTPSNCTNSVTGIIVSDPLPMAITTVETAVTCNGTPTGTITVTNPVGSDYEYSINGGTTWQSSPIFTVPAASYTVTVRKISTNCVNTKSSVVSQPAMLTATAVQSKQVSCANNDGEITITPNGGTAPYQYSINGTTYQPSNVLSLLTIGNYNNIMVKDANGCLANVNSVSITLNDTMRLSIGNDTTICAETSITLAANTNPETNIFTWTPNDGTLSSTTAPNPVASPKDTTKYTLVAKFGVCQRTDDIIVNVLHKPVGHAGKDTVICAKTTATLSGTASNLSGTAYYSWSPDANITYTSLDSSRAIAKPDTTQQYAFVVKDGYGCNFVVTDTMKVIIQAPIIPFAGNDTIAMLHKPHQLQATGGSQYVWTPAAPLNHDSIANPIAILNTDTYFTVLITDSIGCTATDDIFIKVYEGPMYYVPNAFTPNGDGVNDVFLAVPPGIKTTYYFRVFDRYGELLFETSKYMTGWDGTYKGKKQASGTYVWMVKGVDAYGRIVEDKGTFILIR